MRECSYERFFFLLTDTALGIQDYIDCRSDVKCFNALALQLDAVQHFEEMINGIRLGRGNGKADDE